MQHGCSPTFAAMSSLMDYLDLGACTLNKALMKFFSWKEVLPELCGSFQMMKIQVLSTLNHCYKQRILDLTMVLSSQEDIFMHLQVQMFIDGRMLMAL